jgi:hypothetical protein
LIQVVDENPDVQWAEIPAMLHDCNRKKYPKRNSKSVMSKYYEQTRTVGEEEDIEEEVKEAHIKPKKVDGDYTRGHTGKYSDEEAVDLVAIVQKDRDLGREVDWNDVARKLHRVGGNKYQLRGPVSVRSKFYSFTTSTHKGYNK